MVSWLVGWSVGRSADSRRQCLKNGASAFSLVKTVAGPRRDRGGTGGTSPFSLQNLSQKQTALDWQIRGGTEAGPQSAIETVAGPRRDPLTPFGLLKLYKLYGVWGLDLRAGRAHAKAQSSGVTLQSGRPSIRGGAFFLFDRPAGRSGTSVVGTPPDCS